MIAHFPWLYARYRRTDDTMKLALVLVENILMIKSRFVPPLERKKDKKLLNFIRNHKTSQKKFYIKTQNKTLKTVDRTGACWTSMIVHSKIFSDLLHNWEELVTIKTKSTRICLCISARFLIETYFTVVQNFWQKDWILFWFYY